MVRGGLGGGSIRRGRVEQGFQQVGRHSPSKTAMESGEGRAHTRNWSRRGGAPKHPQNRALLATVLSHQKGPSSNTVTGNAAATDSALG